MPRKAQIVIRLLATLCGLYGLLLVGGGLMLTGPGALILHVCWGVWRRLLPVTVRHFGFVIGLILWLSLADSALFAEPLAVSSDGLTSHWRFFGPIGLSVIVGSVTSHVFRRWLFPVATPPSWIERRLRSPRQEPV